MRSFLLKLAGREEGPYSESQVAQMFADKRVNRSTPCKPETGGDWKTIDEYLPTLKYGTQLPVPTPKPVVTNTAPVTTYTRVGLVDLDIPFLSILKMMFKWMAAAFVVFCCFIPAIITVWIIVTALLAALVGGVISNVHGP